DQRGMGYPRILNGIPDIGAVEGVRPEPAAMATSPNISNPTSNPQVVTVTYSDINAIDVGTLSTGDITVTGPNSFFIIPTFKGVDIGTNGTPRVTTYEFTPPGGSWDYTKDGSYTINMVENEVADIGALYVPAGNIGQFVVNIIPPPVSYLVTSSADSG